MSIAIPRRPSTGFTVVELMIVLAILGLIVGIATPAYNGYIATAERHQGRQNGAGLEMALEAYYLSNDSYVTGKWKPKGSKNLATKLDWAPDGEPPVNQYEVAAGACGNISHCYKLTVKDPDGEVIMEKTGP